MNSDKTRRPWDGQLASVLVRPLITTNVSPNHLTVVRLAVGLVAAAVLAHGGQTWLIAGSVLFVLSNFIDHTDGALARWRGTHSEWGAAFDQFCDGLVQVLVFASIGVGLRSSWLGHWAPVLGVVAAGFVLFIFLFHARGERNLGLAASDQPAFAGFEIEDVLYVLPLIVILGGLPYFLISAGIGTPIYGVWAVARYVSLRKQMRSEATPRAAPLVSCD